MLLRLIVYIVCLTITLDRHHTGFDKGGSPVTLINLGLLTGKRIPDELRVTLWPNHNGSVGDTHGNHHQDEIIIWKELNSEIHSDDEPKMIVGYGDKGEEAINKIYQVPLCWAKGTILNRISNTFVMCNAKFELTTFAYQRIEIEHKPMSFERSADQRVARPTIFAYANTNDEKEEKIEKKQRNRRTAQPSSKKGQKKSGKKLEMLELDLDDGMSKGEMRRQCKYRLSCYEANGVLDDLIGDKQKQKAGGLSMKVAPISGDLYEKRTTKDVADAAVKKLKAKSSGAQKPQKDVFIEHRTARANKVRCKYRKSCYKTGVVPEIPKSAIVAWINDLLGKEKEVGKDKEKEDPTDEKSEKEWKVYCRYRKSCYKTGIRVMPTEKVGEKGAIQRFFETWFLGKGEEKKQKIRELTVKPTTIKQLKLYCKYRKSCYEEQAKERKKKDVDDEQVNTEELKEKEEKVVEIEESETKLVQRKSSGRPKHPKKPTKPCNLIAKEPKSKEFDAELCGPKSPSDKDDKSDREKHTPKKEEKSTKQKTVMEQLPPKAEKQAKEKKTKKYTIEEKQKEDLKKHWPEWSRKSKRSKLECKYRKSCYATGRLPDELATIKYPRPESDKNTSISFVIPFFDWLILSSVPNNSERKVEFGRVNEWDSLSRREQMLRCKYRKSCYDMHKKGLRNRAQRRVEELKQPEIKTKEPAPRNDDSKKVKILPSNPIKTVSLKNVDTATKLACKYRKSCYETGDEYSGPNHTVVIARDMNSKKGRVAGEKCNKYYLSCRDKLGLPPKEKAPIGPNGKKLCRRKDVKLGEISQ